MSQKDKTIKIYSGLLAKNQVDRRVDGNFIATFKYYSFRAIFFGWEFAPGGFGGGWYQRGSLTSCKYQ